MDHIEIFEPPIGTRKQQRPPRKQEPPSKPPNYTANDAGRAQRFVDRFQKDIRFVPQRGCWLIWEAGRWRIDEDGALERLAVKLSCDMLAEAARIPGTDDGATKQRAAACAEALECGDRRNIADFLGLAQVDRRILLPVSQLDSDPWIVGAKNAVIELKTGTVRGYSRDDYITRTLGIAVNRQATCPRWKKFMEEVFPDSELRHYVHKALGYTLTGNTEEECFFFCHGTGRNGKSKTITTAEHVFGGLWARAGKGIIAASSWRDYPIRELADIVGARFIIASETKEGEQLNEDVIKDLTGNDSLRAEHKYEKAFTFRAVGKLWIYGNHKPKIGGTDDGIWERVRLIPFTEKFEGDRADPKLSEKLIAEASGILNWMVEGCLLWRKEGLLPPESVRRAVADYRSEEDILKDFLAQHIKADPFASVLHHEVYAHYQCWAQLEGITKAAFSSKGLAKRLRERGFREGKDGRGDRTWVGVSLKDDLNAPDETDETESFS